jgi:hypothetical protein
MTIARTDVSRSTVCFVVLTVTTQLSMQLNVLHGRQGHDIEHSRIIICLTSPGSGSGQHRANETLQSRRELLSKTHLAI